jgi:hypothetical protein
LHSEQLDAPEYPLGIATPGSELNRNALSFEPPCDGCPSRGFDRFCRAKRRHAKRPCGNPRDTVGRTIPERNPELDSNHRPSVSSRRRTEASPNGQRPPGATPGGPASRLTICSRPTVSRWPHGWKTPGRDRGSKCRHPDNGGSCWVLSSFFEIPSSYHLNLPSQPFASIPPSSFLSGRLVSNESQPKELARDGVKLPNQQES